MEITGRIVARLLIIACCAGAACSVLAQEELGPAPPATKRPPPARNATERTPRPGLGGLRGFVTRRDKDDEPVAGAEVSIVDADLRTTTGPDGAYEILDVPPGSQRLRVSKPGFETEVVLVQIRAGRVQEVPVTLAEEGDVIPIMVIGIRHGTTAIKRLEVRQQEAQSTIGIGKAEIVQTAATNAVSAARQLPSVTAVDGKFIYVRGLGGRYSQTLLNGANIPSPEPDKRDIPLDLFPANVLESISIAKTFSPDIPGEFSGGSVQIHTIDVPDKPFLTLGLDIKYRDGTTLRDFNTYHGGNLDKFSFDDGTREIPEEVPRDRVQEGVGGTGLTAENLQEIGRSFPNIWSPDTTTAPFDHKLSLSFGHTLGTKGDRSFAIVGAINWANRYQRIPDEKRRIVINESATNPIPTVFSDFDIDSSTAEAELSALLNLAWEINSAQTIGVRTLYTRSSEDEVRIQTGRDGAQENPIQVERLKWVERSLFTVQPYGEHLIIADTLLEWRAGYSLSQRDEPDNRQTRYVLNPDLGKFSFQEVFGSGRRDFFLLDENIYDIGVDYSIPFNPLRIEDTELNPDKKVPDQRIKLGPALVIRKRDFDARRFLYATGGSSLDEHGNPIDLTADPETLFDSRNINPNGFIINEETRRTDPYEAEQTIAAGYVLADFKLHRRVRLQGGVRIESSEQKVIAIPLTGVSLEPETTKLENTDILPAGNLIWEFWRSDPKPAPASAPATVPGQAAAASLPPAEPQVMQLRLAGSQTVSRPEFRELAPFNYNDVLGGIELQGNPDLQRAKILNLDLSVEWYPAPGELLSAGIFYKQFEDPIEVVNRPTSGTLLTTWENAESADLYGFEVEGRKSLDFITEHLKELTLLANFTYMESEVSIAKNTLNIQTNDKRPLQGQPEYVLNVGALYDSKKLDLTVAVQANILGERISAVGASGLPDEKEQPRWALDLAITKRFGKAAIKLTAENILDAPYEFKVENVTTRKYTRGFAVGIAYSYSF